MFVRMGGHATWKSTQCKSKAVFSERSFCTDPAWTPKPIGKNRPLVFRHGEWYIKTKDQTPTKRSSSRYVRYCQVVDGDPYASYKAVSDAEKKIVEMEKARESVIGNLKEAGREWTKGEAGRKGPTSADELEFIGHSSIGKSEL
ncbi:hypothetical protein HDU67_010032 [Dinochytrium kinnereticum]|nr:hypothetical protein HDU67_010032 [Dinochytrium kinnereticum]